MYERDGSDFVEKDENGVEIARFSEAAVAYMDDGESTVIIMHGDVNVVKPWFVTQIEDHIAENGPAMIPKHRMMSSNSWAGPLLDALANTPGFMRQFLDDGRAAVASLELE